MATSFPREDTRSCFLNQNIYILQFVRETLMPLQNFLARSSNSGHLSTLETEFMENSERAFSRPRLNTRITSSTPKRYLLMQSDLKMTGARSHRILPLKINY